MHSEKKWRLPHANDGRHPRASLPRISGAWQPIRRAGCSFSDLLRQRDKIWALVSHRMQWKSDSSCSCARAAATTSLALCLVRTTCASRPRKPSRTRREADCLPTSPTPHPSPTVPLQHPIETTAIAPLSAPATTAPSLPRPPTDMPC